MVLGKILDWQAAGAQNYESSHCSPAVLYRRGTYSEDSEIFMTYKFDNAARRQLDATVSGPVYGPDDPSSLVKPVRSTSPFNRGRQ